MSNLPASEDTLLIRTHFGDQAAWQAICQEIQEPADEYASALADFQALNAMLGQDIDGGVGPAVKLVDDPTFAGLTPEQLIDRLPADSDQTFLLIVDEHAMTRPDHPILVVDVFNERGRSFRAVPAQVQVIESNLSLANCDWEDFADHVDADGVYRGTPD